MSDNEIVDLYKEGYSIDYIINRVYYSVKRENKVINLKMKKIILITNNFTRINAKEKVYKVIYDYVKKDTNF